MSSPGTSTSGAGAAAAGSASGTASEQPTSTETRTGASGEVAGSSTAEPSVTDSEASAAAAAGDGNPDQAAAGDFDPSEHNVAEVNKHLEDATPAETARVLAAEEAGKARSGILTKNEDPADAPQPPVGENEVIYGSSSTELDVPGLDKAREQRADDMAELVEHPDVPHTREAVPEVGGESFGYGG